MQLYGSSDDGNDVDACSIEYYANATVYRFSAKFTAAKQHETSPCSRRGTDCQNLFIDCDSLLQCKQEVIRSACCRCLQHHAVEYWT